VQGNPEDSMDRFLVIGCVVLALSLAAIPLNGCVIIPVEQPDEDRSGDDDDGGEDGVTRCEDLGGIELTLDGADNVSACFDSWTEAGVPLSIEGTPQCSNGTCTGADGGWDPGNVWTFAGAIVGDLSQLDCEVTEVEVELTDYTGVGAATLTVLAEDGGIVDMAANETPGEFETLTAGLDDGYPIAAFAVGGCETAWHTIRLY
jgi:hypothetical protein